MYYFSLRFFLQKARTKAIHLLSSQYQKSMNLSSLSTWSLPADVPFSMNIPRQQKTEKWKMYWSSQMLWVLLLCQNPLPALPTWKLLHSELFLPMAYSIKTSDLIASLLKHDHSSQNKLKNPLKKIKNKKTDKRNLKFKHYIYPNSRWQHQI